MTAEWTPPAEADLTRYGRYSRPIYGAVLADAAEAALLDLADGNRITEDMRWTVITVTRAALAAARGPLVAEVLAPIHTLLDSFAHNDCPCECCRDDESVFVLRDLLRRIARGVEK